MRSFSAREAMNATEARAVVAAVVDPYLGRPLGEAVRTLAIEGRVARVGIVLPFPVGGYEAPCRERVASALSRAGWSGALELAITAEVHSQPVQQGLQPLPGVKNVLAVASGKGGVGKSTTAANLALALKVQGAAVGILDADIYGPSQPLMMGLVGQRPTTRDGKQLEPPRAHGVPVMSIGFLIDPEQPMVWRGPMVTQALVQLLGDTVWGELDYLIVDLPPGTGDIQLTLSQRVPVSGAIIVTTPQDIALLDARKGLQMFRKVAVPVLGLVENMSTHVCSQCGHEEHIFGAGGGARMAAEYDVPLLGSLPLDRHIREQADGGLPTVLAEPSGPLAARYLDIARRVAARLALLGGGPAFPTISSSDD
jgi:ATP-binding protein involved in chromosome partitioning